MKTSLLLAALCGLSLTTFAQTADIIYHGGPVVTINDAAPRTEAVAVKDGKILAVGANADVLKTKGGATKLVDLAGRAMLGTSGLTAGPPPAIPAPASSVPIGFIDIVTTRVTTTTTTKLNHA